MKADTDQMILREKEIAEKFIEIAAIDGISFNERLVADYLKKAFGELGIELWEDNAGSAIGGNAGNLYGVMDGKGKGKDADAVLFCAHMDTVSPGNNKKVILHDDGRITSDGSTILGADDRAAILAILEAVRMIKENEVDHPPIELLFTTAEEVYTVGATKFDYRKVRSKVAFIPDCSGEYGVFSLTEPSLIYFEVEVEGRGAHAGFEPEKGVNAIAAAASAISRLKQGWVSEETTLNIGSISGGTVSNAVPSRVLLKGEIRSLIHDEALNTLENIRNVFKEETRKLGASFSVKEDVRLLAYRKELQEEKKHSGSAIERYKRALLLQGKVPLAKRNFGGSDANVLIRNGIDVLSIFCPMHDIHTCNEYTTASELVEFTDLIFDLMSDI